MKKAGLPLIAWALAGLLAIAAGLISLGQQDQDAKPEVQSYSPSGVSAFAELLRRNGVDVTINQESKPKLSKGDIAVAFKVLRDDSGFAAGLGSVDEEQAFDAHFWQHIRSGGTGILLPLKNNYLDASRSTKANPYDVVSDVATGRSYKMTSSGIPVDESFDSQDGDDEAVGMSLWTDSNGPFVKAYRLGAGTALIVRDGIGITNRFIDKNDNAKAFGSLFSMLAKSGKHVVFTEASFGNIHDKGLLETVGAWANAAWQQLLFLGVVVAVTLGKRFGTPDEQRPVQRGSRELLDAVADTYRRANSTQAALMTANSTADADLRRALKLPKDATRSERDRLIPVSLQNALARLQVASEYTNVTQQHALDLVVKAQTELDAFIGPNRAKLLSLAKLRA